MTTKEQELTEIENGCGYQETYNRSSFCKKDNFHVFRDFS